MEWLDTVRDGARAADLAAGLRRMELPPMRLMEVCGTHTVAICRHGIRGLMPEAVTLTSGPGCPVCVTATEEIDAFVKAARIPGVILTTFGDLMRVPGTRSTLQKEAAAGADIRPVYSTMDALTIARNNPKREVIFLGVGFETTTPTIAAAVLIAEKERLKNFSIISAHKIMPPALNALLADPAIKIDGLICPGHVSVMIGPEAYRPYAENFHIPCVITGFEPVDILEGIILLACQVRDQEAKVAIAYKRAVEMGGNARAMAVMHQVFEPCDGVWRGLGTIPASGLEVRREFAGFNARARFDLEITDAMDPAGCACGDVLKSIILPNECPLFGKRCTPEHPVGPCMVSGEGSCGVFHRFMAAGS